MSRNGFNYGTYTAGAKGTSLEALAEPTTGVTTCTGLTVAACKESTPTAATDLRKNKDVNVIQMSLKRMANA